jgi:hypothetical protein
MKPPVTLNDWAIELCEGQKFQAPEARDHIHLSATIDGKMKLTSRIVHIDGRTVITKTGSVYVLGDPSAAYLVFLVEQGRTLDEAEPVKLLGRARARGAA